VIDAPWVTVGALALWVMAASAWRRRAPFAERAIPLIGGSVLLSPNVFPWYAVWLVPFLAVMPSLPWLAFTGTLALAYAFLLQTPWAIPWWARVLEFLPLAIGAAAWLTRHRPLVTRSAVPG